MWFPIPMTIVTLSLTLNPKILVTYAASAGKSANVSKGRETKLASWIKKTSAGIQLCEQKCTEIGECHRHVYLRGMLYCKLHNTPFGKIISERHTQRISYVTVLSKAKWQACPTVVCSLTQVCTSLKERDCKPLRKKKLDTRKTMAFRPEDWARTVQLQFAKKTGSGNKALNKIKMTKSASKPQNQVTMRHITHITSSSRYSNIVYGHGPNIEVTDRIISLNISHEVSGSVREHIWDCTSKMNVLVKVCGLTTGPCCTGNKTCVYICFFSDFPLNIYGLSVFEEPDIDKYLMKLKCSYARFAEKTFSVISIAMDENSVMYALGVDGRKITIRAYHIFQNNQIIGRKLMKVLFMPRLTPLSLDIKGSSRENHLLIFSELSIWWLVPDNLPYQTQVKTRDLKLLHPFKGIRRTGKLLCLSASGRYVVYVDKHFPYKSKRYRLR